MQRKDWTLLLLAAANGETLTPVQLQKTAFLLGRKHPQDVGSHYYVFQHYDYGAFSADVYRDAEVLAHEGYAIIQLNQYGRWKEYRATPAGMERANNIKKRISVDAAKTINDTVAWARSMSFQELVRAIYKEYPETKENSIFQD